MSELPVGEKEAHERGLPVGCPESWTPLRSVFRLAWLVPALALSLSACASGGGDAGEPELSRFTEGGSSTGRALVNVTACEVDAVCYLEIQFADTTVRAVYGTGERPAPPCEMTVEVSDVAFRVEPGEVIDVVVSPCGSEGLYLESIARGGA